MRDERLILADKLWRIVGTYGLNTMAWRTREVIAEHPGLADAKAIRDLLPTLRDVVRFGADSIFDLNCALCSSAHDLYRDAMGVDGHEAWLDRVAKRQLRLIRAKLFCYLLLRGAFWHLRPLRWLIEDRAEPLMDEKSNILYKRDKAATSFDTWLHRQYARRIPQAIRKQSGYSVKTIIGRYERELERSLATWEDRMEAVAAGVIEADDAYEIAHGAAEIADRGDSYPESAAGLNWRATIGDLLDKFYPSDDAGDPLSVLGSELVRCGRAADAALRCAA